jgi:hypothetical protein
MIFKTQKEAMDHFYQEMEKCTCSSSFSHLFKRTGPDRGEIDLKESKKYFKNLSDGEKIMFSFFTNVFLGRDEYKLSIIDAVDRLDDTNRILIAKWFADPYFP